MDNEDTECVMGVAEDPFSVEGSAQKMPEPPGTVLLLGRRPDELSDSELSDILNLVRADGNPLFAIASEYRRRLSIASETIHSVAWNVEHYRRITSR